MKLRHALAGASLALLIAAAPAAADSIAYIKNDNIWLANGDGSGQVQITHDGTAVLPYRSPSQADDGRIAAAHGSEIVLLAQTGQTLAAFPPPTATDSTGQVITDVPQQVAISPDGSRLAYVYSQPSCPPAAPCGVRQELLYSYSDRTTPVATFGEQTNLTNPSWINDNLVLAFGGHFRQVNIDSPGGGNDDAVHWFDDAGNEDVGDGELSRQGDRLALVRSYGANTHLAIYHAGGGPGGPAPEPACFTGTDASLAGPSWSPDGTKLAFQDAQGIEVLPLPKVTDGDCPGAGSSTLILPAALQPDWGPASIRPDAGTWSTAQAVASPPASGSTPPPATRATLTATIPHRLRLRGASGTAIVIRARASINGRIVTRALIGRSVLGRTGTSATAGATVTLRIRLGAARLRRLRHAHTQRLAIIVTLTAADGTQVTHTATARITK
jgi:WD40-like Beta Propeller Repeat